MMIFSEIISVAMCITGLYILRHAPVFQYRAIVYLGIIVLTALFTGRLFKRIGLPVITGYMFSGLIISPFTFGLTPLSYINDFKMIDYFAITFIGMQAGSEMRMKILKRDLKAIMTTTVLIIILSATGVILIMMLLKNVLFHDPRLQQNFIYLLMFLAVFEIAKSPVTTIAIINETGIKNKFTYRILGITIFKDIILVLIFTGVTAFVEFSARNTGIGFSEFSPVLIELLGSLLLGFILAMTVTVYLKYISVDSVLFISVCAFVISVIGDHFHINPLIAGISAGFFIENFSEKNRHFEKSLSKLSPFIYILFFPMASAVLDIKVVPSVIIPVIVLLLMRKLLVFTSFAAASRIVKLEKYTITHGWMGLINQSGITLALAIIISKTLDSIGMSYTGMYLKTVAIASIIITDFYGPPLFRYAVLRSSRYFAKIRSGLTDSDNDSGTE